MGVTSEREAVEQPRTPLNGLRLRWLVVGAAVGGFIASVGLTALLPAVSRLRVGEWGALLLFAAAAFPLALIDARTFRLPNRGTFPLAAALAGYWLGLALTTGAWGRFLQAMLCAVAIAIVALIIGMIGTLAFGDIKLMLAIGLLTGWVSWMLPLYALVAGYLLAIPHATAILARKRRRGGTTELPFGPYLIAGAAVVTVIALLTPGVRG